MKLAVLLFLICVSVAQAQKGDSIATGNSYASGRRRHGLQWIIPVALVATGTVTMLDSDADEFFLSNFEIREERNEKFMNFSNHLDDYLQHVPSVTCLVLSIAGIDGRHTVPNQIAILVKSEVLMLGTVYALKYTVGESRPDTGKANSFPSGHTAQAFAAATFLSREYGDRSILIGVGAYVTATTVGVFRMLNNRHWISDVLVGAGIGILSTDLVYLTHKNRWGRDRSFKSLKIDPYSAYGSNGFSVCYRF
jgi:membrane-associated phospholipid phosphatase